MNLTADDVTALGKKILTMEREFNKKAGFTAAHDRLPDYFKKEAIAPHNVIFDIEDDVLDSLYNW